jgi:hypothetical protein
MGKPSASNIIAKSQSTQEEIAKGFADVRKSMSALPPKADMCGALVDVRFGPKADIGDYSTTSSAIETSAGGIASPSVWKMAPQSPRELLVDLKSRFNQ